MGMIGVAVLLANSICFLLLYKHRADDLNMRSTWLCSRNDLIANCAVLAAAAAVNVFGSQWPDLIVGVSIAALFSHGAFTVLSESIAELQKFKSPSQNPA